ncbi:MAG: hypothetical protein MK116_11965 [Phycisphaerales bacterium]|nr:hypothetical protein [Phycisphaerales bacterium]
MEGYDAQQDPGGVLDPRDAELFDQLVEVDFDVKALPDLDASTRNRAERLVAMMGLLDDYPVEPVTAEDRDVLVSATLARINRAEDEQRDRMRIDTPGVRARFRIREFVAVAAVVLLGLAVVIPMMRNTAHLKGVEGSHARLLDLGAALSSFAGDNNGEAPSALADHDAYPEVVGYRPTTFSLAPLAAYGISAESLNNPMRPDQPGAGFSFHSQRGPRIHLIGIKAGTVIISDRNLYLEQLLSGQAPALKDDVKACVLLSDISVSQCTTSRDGDHIWDCDRQRIHGPSASEIFLIHGATRPATETGQQAAPGAKPASAD